MCETALCDTITQDNVLGPLFAFTQTLHLEHALTCNLLSLMIGN